MKYYIVAPLNLSLKSRELSRSFFFTKIQDFLPHTEIDQYKILLRMRNNFSLFLTFDTLPEKQLSEIAK